jgi:predicted RNase H-like nuclease (RuvC/YqgF family)
MGELENRGKQVEHLNEMLAARDERIKALKEELDSLRAGRGK